MCPVVHRRSLALWNNEVGFTLIELVVTLVLLGIVAVLAARVLSTSLDMWITTEEYAGERADQVAALERMVREIRQADSLTCTHSTLSLERGGNILDFEASNETLTLTFKTDDGTLRLDEEPLCPTDYLEDSEPRLCEPEPSDDPLLCRLSLSDPVNEEEGSTTPEVTTHVYPRNASADCRP